MTRRDAQDKATRAGKTATPQFLDLKSYRRKRLIDAAKLLPILGAAALLFPLPFFFVDMTGGGPAKGDATVLAIYFFGAWLVLIVAALVLAHALKDPATGG